MEFSRWSMWFCVICWWNLLHILVVGFPKIQTDIWEDEKNGTGLKNQIQNSYGSHRQGKVLNFFPIPFEEECLSKTDGRRKGICMNTYECRIQGGSSHGPCALGFGVCCIFTATCGNEAINNITYFVNPDFPDLSKKMSSCTLKVKKIHPDVSQMRLDFIHFNLGQPNRLTGICEDDVFLLSGGKNSKNLTVCGTNDDQHVYFDVDSVEESVMITMNLSDKVISRLWEIRIIQIPFNERVPEGCLQYHTGLTGIVKTMNFAENGRHLANQNYNICLRQEKGTCSIVYEPCHKNAFKIGPGQNNTSGVNSDAFSDVGSGDGEPPSAREDNSCNDRVVVPCPFEDLIMPGNVGVGFCDLSLCGSFSCPSGEADCKVETNVVPFRIGIHFGPVSREESPEDNLGVCLKYEQQLCTV